MRTSREQNCCVKWRLGRIGKLIEPTRNVLRFNGCGLCRHCVVLVVQSDVVEDVFWVGAVHALEAIFNNCCNFVSKCWVVRLARRNRASEYQTVAILMLQAFTHECGATSCCAQEETSRACVGCLPNEVTYALEAKHGIERVEGHHGHTARCITCSCCNKGSQTSCFGNTFFENLSVGCFYVRQQEVVVDWFVLLTLACIDTQFAEKRIHAKGACFVGNDGHNAWAKVLIASQVAQ